MWLQPFNLGDICIVSVFRTWNIDGVCITTGSIHTNSFCLSLQMWQVLQYQLTSLSSSGHQNLFDIKAFVAKKPLWPRLLCRAFNIYIHLSFSTTSLCVLSTPLQYSCPFFLMKKCIAALTNLLYSCSSSADN